MSVIEIIGNIKDRVIKFFVKSTKYYMPSRTFASCFGVGFLPEWQLHWAAFIGLLIALLVVYLSVGFEASLIEIAGVVVILAVICFFIGMISIYLFKMHHPDTDERIAVHSGVGQMFVLGFSVPTMVVFSYKVMTVNNSICGVYFYCASWFYKVITYFTIFAFPYAVYRLFDIIMPWPSSYLNYYMSNPVSKMMEGLINAAYTIVAMYLIAFIFFDLTLVDALKFNSEVLSYIGSISIVGDVYSSIINHSGHIINNINFDKLHELINKNAGK